MLVKWILYLLKLYSSDFIHMRLLRQHIYYSYSLAGGIHVAVFVSVSLSVFVGQKYSDVCRKLHCA